MIFRAEWDLVNQIYKESLKYLNVYPMNKVELAHFKKLSRNFTRDYIPWLVNMANGIFKNDVIHVSGVFRQSNDNYLESFGVVTRLFKCTYRSL